MNIETLKKKLEAFVFRPVEGESWEFVWERQKELNPNRSLFWRVLIRTLSKFLAKVYSVSLSTSESLALVLAFSLSKFVDIFWFIRSETPSKVELLRYECDRDPPKIFVPLPYAETGGCARNDSVTAPAI